MFRADYPRFYIGDNPPFIPTAFIIRYCRLTLSFTFDKCKPPITGRLHLLIFARYLSLMTVLIWRMVAPRLRVDLYYCFLALGITAPLCAQKPLFSLVPSQTSNLTFKNEIIENEKINILTYEYFHNGGGVAIGDINNDGLADIYLTGNLAPNRLYLNKGDLRFEDITKAAGTGGSQGWATGVTMVDINQDGWLDIYVCYSGNLPEPYRANQLFVNNQDGTFTERAAEYGIDDTGYATHASFFDYDLDGDLDLYILNHNIFPIENFKPDEVRNSYDPNVGDKLYENDNGKFSNVNLIANIHTNPLGYGLGVSIGDLNNDRYPDIYIANDFIEHDYCYINNGDGTFRDVVKEAFPQISQFSMGTDMADFNNDGLLDIISVDMIAEDNYRQKTTMRPMNRNIFYYAVEDGFHYQYMHNALQLNRGNGHFSNISKLAGVSATDWSWAPLFVDLDLDGWKDLVVTNGYKKDISNKDYVAFEKEKLKKFKEGEITNTELFRALLDAAPVTKIENYVFRNNGDYTFEKMNEAWNFDQQAFSNGAAYGDLDNDGDADLVINNIDDEPYLFRNNAIENSRPHFLKVKLDGPPSNKNGLGAKIWVHAGGQVQFFESYLSRGFQSSVDPVLCVGLGSQSMVDTVRVEWPDGSSTIRTGITADQLLTFSHEAATTGEEEAPAPAPLFHNITGQLGLESSHRENSFDDFAFEVLLPHKMSTWGPALAVGDINADGLSDFYLGGAHGFAGQLFAQQSDGTFRPLPGKAFTAHQDYEDVGAAFFDADNDGDVDLYVASGGNEWEAGAPQYADRLYLNDGAGNFSHQPDALPELFISASVVRPYDYDQDGDLDLFVGGRMQPRSYPMPADSKLLRNDGGVFADITAQAAPALEGLGMVTDALWCDYDQDGDSDLLLTGEWMPVTIFSNNGASLQPLDIPELSREVGWWFSIQAGDFDGDGDQDFIAGNLGTNYKYKASHDQPFQVFLNDFDENGSKDIVLGYFESGELYPVRGRQCSAEQMPFIKKKFPTYDLFAQASLADIYGPQPLQQSLNYQATNFHSSYIENRGNNSFRMTSLSVEAQFSAINAILLDDFNGDGRLDALTAGNLYASEVETPRNDAGVGCLLLGDGKGGFTTLSAQRSGVYLPYDIRHLAAVATSGSGKRTLLAVPNNDKIQILGSDRLK